MDCYAIGDRPLSVAWSFNGAALKIDGNPRYGAYHCNNIIRDMPIIMIAGEWLDYLKKLMSYGQL